MTKQEIAIGLRQGRRLCQEKWADQAEIKAVDELSAARPYTRAQKPRPGRRSPAQAFPRKNAPRNFPRPGFADLPGGYDDACAIASAVAFAIVAAYVSATANVHTQGPAHD
jgi:hypothetical protein